MTREEFMDIVYSELQSDGDNYRANRIIDAADEYAEDSSSEKLKIGKWIGVNPMVDTLMCSECGENIISEEFKSNYCPNCGAKMEVSKNEVCMDLYTDND